MATRQGSSRSVALALALVAALLLVASCGGDDDEESDEGKVTIVYEDAAIKPANRAAVKLVRDSGALETIADWTNEAIALPHDLEMKVSDDMPKGVLAPIADPDGRTIYIPAEFFTENHELLRGSVRAIKRERGRPKVIPKQNFNADDLTVAAEEFIVGHEMGHALTRQLLLPVTGLEEDAVDGFGAFFSINFEKAGRDPVIGAAALFDELQIQQGKSPTAEDYASDHPVTKQRVFNFICFAAGSDAKKRQLLVEGKYLPEIREPVCGLEWAQLDYGWWTVLEPHLKEDYKSETADQRKQARENLISETNELIKLVRKIRGE